MNNTKALMNFSKDGISLSVCELDLISAYPNCALSHQILPEKDTGGEFYQTLLKLDELRNKERILGEPIEDLRKLKKFSNALIGCLKNKEFKFYDPSQHDLIVLECREIMKKVLLILKNYEDKGILRIIRLHTDGVYLNIKKKICEEEILPKINEYLQKNWGIRYKFRIKEHYQRGLFKNINNFFLWTQDKEPIAKGVFFKEYKELTSALIQGYYNTATGVPRDYSKYEELKGRLLKNPTKKLYSLLNYLEGVKSGYPMV